jgi:hypothetical protein
LCGDEKFMTFSNQKNLRLKKMFTFGPWLLIDFAANLLEVVRLG